MSAAPLWLGAGLLLSIGCSSPSPQSREPVGQRSRDSVLGASGLPGAQGVRRAMGAGDSAAARNARLDSVANGR